MIARDEILARSTVGGDRFPLLTVDEFFDGNDDEQSIAPNQYGYGRPDLAEIAGRLETLAADPAVAWVRIQPHEEMFEADYPGIAAESVAICSSMSNEDIDARLDVESLMSEGVFEGFSYDEKDYCEIPEIPTGYNIFTLTWSLTRLPRLRLAALQTSLPTKTVGGGSLRLATRGLDGRVPPAQARV